MTTNTKEAIAAFETFYAGLDNYQQCEMSISDFYVAGYIAASAKLEAENAELKKENAELRAKLEAAKLAYVELKDSQWNLDSGIVHVASFALMDKFDAVFDPIYDLQFKDGKPVTHQN